MRPDSADAALASEAVWLSALRAAGRSHRTLEHYDYCTRTLRDWRSANDHLSTLTRIEALAYVRHLTENRAPAGALSHLRSLRARYGYRLGEAFRRRLQTTGSLGVVRSWSAEALAG